MQMHYNESRVYPGAEVEEESTYSAPVALGLSVLRSSFLQRFGTLLPVFLPLLMSSFYLRESYSM